MQMFSEVFHSHVSPEDILILGVSGGVDSMVLLDLVRREVDAERIIVAHFDHSLRGAESDGDRDFVDAKCASSGIRCIVEKRDIATLAKEQKMSIEAMARNERYRFFESIRAEYGAKYILTAHHEGDQSETILLHLMQGGKSRGLSGMNLISGYIFRPLLSLPKSLLIDYAKMHHIDYREDSSNSDIIYTRNRIRHDILPVLRELNPRIDMTLSDLALYHRELREFLLHRVDVWFHDESTSLASDGVFRVSSFEREDVFFQKEIIVTLYSRAHNNTTHGLSQGLIEELMRYIFTAVGATRKIVGNLTLEKKKNQIHYN